MVFDKIGGIVISIIQGIAAAFNIVQGIKANRAAREKNKIAGAAETSANRRAVRRGVRERRFKEAQILQTGENAGFAGSSLSLGASASLAANLANNVALQSGSAITNKAISNQNQKIANAESAAKTFGNFANLLETSIDAFGGGP